MKKSPLPKLLLLLVVTVIIGFMLYSENSMPNGKQIHDLMVWVFGFMCGGTITAFILKW